MTSSKKKHHPRVVSPPRPTPPAVIRPTTTTNTTTTTTTTGSRSTRSVWIARVLGLFALIAGITMTLIGVTPDILGGWGKLGLMVPGMVLAAGGLIAVVETTSWARSKRRR